jgi:hypothetical protein
VILVAQGASKQHYVFQTEAPQTVQLINVSDLEIKLKTLKLRSLLSTHKANLQSSWSLKWNIPFHAESHWKSKQMKIFKIDAIYVWSKCMRVMQKVSSDGLLKRKLFSNHLYCHLMSILSTTFPHSFHNWWGTCHSRPPAFLSLHCWMMLPAMQITC